MTFVPLVGNGAKAYPRLTSDEVYPDRAQAKNLIDSVIDPARILSPGILGLAAMKVVEATCLSARSRENVSIGASRRSPA